VFCKHYFACVLIEHLAVRMGEGVEYSSSRINLGTDYGVGGRVWLRDGL
jgi:hypothetical protein